MKKIIKLILLIALMALIFYFSSQPAVDSIDTTNGFIVYVYAVYDFCLGFINKLSLQEFSDLYFAPIRKLAHFSEFMCLGILMYINSTEYFSKNNLILSIVFSGLYAISDEIHQLFVLNRYCSVIDMLIDTSGATFGIILVHLIYKKWIKK